jgi:hypothetical protein
LKNNARKKHSTTVRKLALFGDVKRAQSIHVLMPYVERLRLFGFGYRSFGQKLR